MMIAAHPRLMSADEFYDQYAGKHVELVDGMVQQMTPAGGEHGAVAAHLLALLWNSARRTGAGEVFAAETGFVLQRDPAIVRAADASYIGTEHLVGNRITKRFIEGAPDIAAEVKSPDDTWPEVARKVADYLAAGTPIVWVLDPATRTVTVYTPDAAPRRLGEADELTGDPVLPDFRCSVRELFS